MKIVKWIDKYFEEILCVFTMALVVFFTFTQVLFRFVLNLNLDWTEELARYSFVALVYFGISLATKMNAHIRVEVVEKFVRGRVKTLIMLIASIIWLAFALLITKSGYELAAFQLSTGQSSPVLLIPMGLMYGFIPLGFALMSVRVVQLIVKQFIELIKGSGPEAAEQHQEPAGSR